MLFNYSGFLSSLTSSSGQPVDRSTACDCRISNLSSLSLISASWVGLFRRMVILSVTTEVNSPRMSFTETSGLSEMASNERAFQFLMEIDPGVGVKDKRDD